MSASIHGVRRLPGTVKGRGTARAGLAVAIMTAAGAVGVLGASPAQGIMYSYFDTTFNLPDWVDGLHVNTSMGATYATGQVFVGGSPLGPSTPNNRQVSHSYPGGVIVVRHQGVNFAWSPLPLETAVSVDYQYDLAYYDSGSGGAVGYAPAIFQGGGVYRAPIDNIFQREWLRFNGFGIPISSFQLINTSTGGLLASTPNPNLAMDFGYVSANSASITAFKVSAIDNFGIRLNTTVVPEPTALAALAPAAMVLGRRRRGH